MRWISIFGFFTPKIKNIIGLVNHFTESAQVPDIAYGILTIIRTIRTQLPDTRILLVSILPRNGVEIFDNIVAINSIIETYHDGQQVFYLDIFDEFTGATWGSKLFFFLIISLQIFRYFRIAKLVMNF